MSLSINIGRPFLNDKTLDEQARSILRLYGTDAHVYLPGANGVAIGGLNSGNYVESTFNTLASVDSVVGGVRDPIGSIDATQATTANKPALRRGLLNLAYPSDPAHTDWAKVGATPVTGGIQEDTSGGTHRTQRNITIPSGSPVTARVKLLSTTRNAQLELGGGTGGASVTFGLSGAGSVLVAAATYGTGWTVQAATIRLDSVDGYYECVLSATPNSGVTSVVSYLYMTSGSSAAYTGNGTSTLLTKEFGLFAGTLTAAQILSEGGIPLTTSAAASNPSAGRYSWQFDGSNDSLLTGNLAITNAVCITIAGRLDSLAATSVLLGEDTGGVSISVATNGAVSFDKLGTGALVTSSAGLIVAGTPFVLTCRLSGGTAVIRKNGTQSASSASGTTFAATTGARLGGTFAGASYCTGALSQIDVIVGAVTDADALTLERNAASNLVAGPTF